MLVTLYIKPQILEREEVLKHSDFWDNRERGDTILRENFKGEEEGFQPSLKEIGVYSFNFVVHLIIQIFGDLNWRSNQGEKKEEQFGL